MLASRLTMSAGTPFHDRTAARNAKLAWGDWAGRFAAAAYADHHDIEYNALRHAAGVIDVSPLYKYELSGPDAVRLVDRVVTRDATRLAVGQVMYTPWCDDRGKVLDDGTVTRLDGDRFRWTAADPSFRWLRMNAGELDVDVRDVTDQMGALALQGPHARAVLEAATGDDLSGLAYFRRRPASVDGLEIDVTRTGYTGDLGYELWIPAEAAGRVWDALMAAGEEHAIRPVGIRAMDVARVEAGLILIEVDYTSARHAMTAEHEYSPFEIGLGRLVNLRKPAFVGRRALLAEQERGGPRRRLVGLDMDWAGIEAEFARHDLPPAVEATVSRDPVPLRSRRGQAGRATSTCWSPTLKKLIALGSVDARYEAPGTRLRMEWSVEGERGWVAATVVPLPFMDLPRRRA
jgi:glycine cleavage system T protein (aminomethyltransferase)